MLRSRCVRKKLRSIPAILNIERLPEAQRKTHKISRNGRNPLPNHGLWEQQRKKEGEFLGANPAVSIIGAGQSGLEMAAHSKATGVSSHQRVLNNEVHQWKFTRATRGKNLQINSSCREAW